MQVLLLLAAVGDRVIVVAVAATVGSCDPRERWKWGGPSPWVVVGVVGVSGRAAGSVPDVGRGGQAGALGGHKTRSRCGCLLWRQTSCNNNQRRRVCFLVFIQQLVTSVDCMHRHEKWEALLYLSLSHPSEPLSFSLVAVIRFPPPPLSSSTFIGGRGRRVRQILAEGRGAWLLDPQGVGTNFLCLRAEKGGRKSLKKFKGRRRRPNVCSFAP